MFAQREHSLTDVARRRAIAYPNARNLTATGICSAGNQQAFGHAIDAIWVRWRHGMPPTRQQLVDPATAPHDRVQRLSIQNTRLVQMPALYEHCRFDFVATSVGTRPSTRNAPRSTTSIRQQVQVEQVAFQSRKCLPCHRLSAPLSPPVAPLAHHLSAHTSAQGLPLTYNLTCRNSKAPRTACHVRVIQPIVPESTAASSALCCL